MKSITIMKSVILAAFGSVCIIILGIWLLIIIYRLNVTRKKYNKILLNHKTDILVRSQNIYYLKTARNKDIFLCILVIVEIVTFACSLIIAPTLLDAPYRPEIERIIHNTFPETCTLNNLIAIMYIYPATVLLAIFYFMLVITQFMIISFINRYIAARYLGYSLAKTTCYKYITCWIFVGLFLVIFCIQQLQIFLFPSVTIILILNWCNLVISSKKLCKAIQSKLDEIRRFEWNPTHFRQLSNNLKFYKYTMGFIIISFLFTVLLGVILSISYPLEILLVGDCYMHKVFNIRTFNFDQGTKDTIFHYFKQIYQWLVYALEIIYIVLLMSPSVYIFTYYLANYLYNLCTGRGNVKKLNKTLFDPLIESSH